MNRPSRSSAAEMNAAAACVTWTDAAGGHLFTLLWALPSAAKRALRTESAFA
jgi:hypothetical protein